jgi:quinoprotein glucose dehydrogenase
MTFPRRYVASALLSAIIPLAAADEAGNAKKKDDRFPSGNATQQSAEAALRSFAIAPGLQVEVWASEPLLANPVAFTFDPNGHAYVTETHRRRSSVPDIRKYEAWTLENLALRSVEQRTAFFKSKFPESGRVAPSKDRPDVNSDGQFDWHDLEVESEIVRLIEDSNGDGKADRSKVFAEGFNSLGTGVAAGIAIHNGDTFFTCTPDLWKIKADGTKEKLFTGFGVHVAYSGHDMHGAKVGPDGRLYWSIADCGARVVDGKGQVLIDVPDTGAVFRCNLDGTDLKLIAKGLRNPQSLAFNEVGDLFTGDNNADGGDKARWIHVVPGADYGWRIGWQFLPKLGAWNAEGMWHLDAAKNHNAILPPAGHVGHGPAGIAYYPGSGLPDIYRDHFFYADFPGGIRSFKLVQQGASYIVENPGDFLMDNSPQKMTGKVLWNLYPSDVAFAPGGGLFVLDWIYGWEKTGKGRIFRVFDRTTDSSELVQETKRLLNDGFSKLDDARLAQLLRHADQRIRIASQFELVNRDKTDVLIEQAEVNPSRIARLHAVWGLDQVMRKTPLKAAGNSIFKLVSDPDAEVRAQAVKVLLSNAPVGVDSGWLVKLLRDSNPRVRFFACGFFCKPGQIPKGTVEALVDLLGQAKDDAFLRFAAIGALDRIGLSEQELATLPAHVAAQLLQHLPASHVPQLLSNPDQKVALDAARRIHDTGLSKGWEALAAMASTPGLGAPFWSRAVNACYLLGTADSAELLGRAAVDARLSPEQRTFALESLAIWTAPFGRDRITGLWRDLPPRLNAKGSRETAARIVPILLTDPNSSVRVAAANLAGATAAIETETALLGVANDQRASGEVRAAALHSLGAMASAKLPEAVNVALANGDPLLLEAARKLSARISPAEAVRVNAAVLSRGSIREKQDAILTISQLHNSEADQVIEGQLDQLIAAKLAKGLWLDVLEAAAGRNNQAIKKKLTDWRQTRASNDPLALWRECLEGGDAKLGREIFYEKAEAACMRCHKVKGEGGDVGPDLAVTAKKGDREHLLRSIVDPNAMITPGYESVILTLTDGNMAAGILGSEGASEITLKSLTDGTPQTIEKSKVKERASLPSAMPPGLGDVLGKRALRDLVQYLATLK